MSQGKIRECGHCHGTGYCGATARVAKYQASWRNPNAWNNSCPSCVIKAGLDRGRVHKFVICSVCGGKKSFWIGPNTVS